MSPGRIRTKVVVAKVAAIREMLSAADTLPLDSLASFEADPRMVAAGESFLRRALEALLDLGRHVLAKGFGNPVVEYKGVPRGLVAAGILPEEMETMGVRMAGYRNRMVHFYDEVSSAELYQVLVGHRSDLEAILGHIEDWIRANPDRLDDTL